MNRFGRWAAGISIIMAAGCGAKHDTAQLGQQAQQRLEHATALTSPQPLSRLYQKAKDNIAKGDAALEQGEYGRAKHWYQRAIIDVDYALTLAPNHEQR